MTTQLQTPPTPGTGKPEKDNRKKFVAAGAFGLSTVFHVVLLFLVGGTVLIQGIIPKAKFESTIEPTPTVTETPEEVPPDEQDAVSLVPPTEVIDEPIQAIDTKMPELIVTETINPLQNHIPPPPVMPSAPRPDDAPKPNNTVDETKAKMLKNMTSFFGDKSPSTDSISGYLYDLKQTADRKDSNLAEDPRKNDADAEKTRNLGYVAVLNEFLKRWDESALEKYYKTKSPLSTSQIFIPMITATEAPKAFDVDRYVKPKRWVIHYKGEYTPPKSGTFRFVGMADDVMVVRFNRDLALNASLSFLDAKLVQETIDKSPSLGRMNLKAGPWIKMHAGQSYPIEVLLGELPGGVFFAFLMLQEQGVTYPSRPNGSPILPLFQTTPTRLPKYDPEKNAPTVADPSKS